MSKRRTHSPVIKAKVAIEAIKPAVALNCLAYVSSSCYQGMRPASGTQRLQGSNEPPKGTRKSLRLSWTMYCLRYSCDREL